MLLALITFSKVSSRACNVFSFPSSCLDAGDEESSAELSCLDAFLDLLLRRLAQNS